MSDRLKIGTYILDADGSSSTTTGVTLLLEETDAAGIATGESLLKWRIGKTEAVISAMAHITASSAADLRTRTDALIAAIAGAKGDIIYESDDNVSRVEFKTSTGDYTRIDGEIEIEDGELAAIATIRLVLARPEPAADTPTGIVGAVEVNVERALYGGLMVVLEATFRDLSNVEAYVHANNWIASVISRTGTPAWLANANTIRVIGVPEVFVRKDSGGTIAGECTARVQMKQFPSRLASNAAFASSLANVIRSLEYRVSALPRTLDAASGAEPLTDFTITGTIGTKIEGDVTLDTNETAPAYLTDAQLSACLDAVEAQVLSGMGIANASYRGGRAVTRALDSGDIEFSIPLWIGTSTILTWDETVSFNTDSVDAIDAAWDGKEWEYPAPQGDTETCQHDITIESIGVVRGYPGVPSGAKGWKRIAARIHKPTEIRTAASIGGGTPAKIYRTTASVLYRRVKGAGGGQGSRGRTQTRGTTLLGGN
jgi:hypothetical protein